jgi:hypothetical protein
LIQMFWKAWASILPFVVRWKLKNCILSFHVFSIIFLFFLDHTTDNTYLDITTHYIFRSIAD